MTQETTLAKGLYYLADDEAICHTIILNSIRTYMTASNDTTSEALIKLFVGPYRNLQQHQSHHTLVYNLLRFHEKQCFDPCDRVHSLLSVSQVGKKFNVDYGILPFRLAQTICAHIERICICDAAKAKM
ncbi:hypothetical protein CC86DRAFT_196403 [Ophiobolus disseminans]|uniref:Uncharacterized protein n=1 Tax=Ophiobolus disseminans TaxID=1469910 RepID=A0A6A7A5U3_9PLEO|nr:hypothetical protein CC86DRAFT_196403 [Ophiobolus disseminans]